MEEKVNIKKALRVFQEIISKGVKHDDGFHLSGLVAFTDFDGYTVTIKNDYVRLDILFHNKISFTCANDKERYQFLELLDKLDKNASKR